ncbi:MAG TPA: glycosyl hydrolase family 28 protein [Candidatus Sulfotelmatobacter sp.]|nr:glycosyl hydrolase family 28 protein [Candidatus Sulfotelmatobacter sp.]
MLHLAPFLFRFPRQAILAGVVLVFGAVPTMAGTPWSLLINTNNIIVVTASPYNAVGDGVTTNTTAIQNAINAASLGGVTNGLRGGTVEIPAAAASYLCGPLNMSNFVNLQIDSGAMLQMLPFGSYPGGDSPADFITASKNQNIELSGFGTIDGQGSPWWTDYDTNSSLMRPYTLFGPSGCSTVVVCNVTFQNPPNTHMSFGSSGGSPCNDVLITNITINTPDGTPNTDGIDFDAANAVIINSYISDGDDHIAIGGTSGFMHDILVTNCFFGTGHGMSIGSYTSAGVSNLLVTHCAWSGSENGLRLKSERGRGGLVQDLTYENLSMTNVQWPILFYSYYQYGEGQLEDATPYMAATDAIQTVTSTTPIWRNIVVSNLTATTAKNYPAIMIWGLPEMLISNVTLNGVNINGSGAKTCQFYYTTNLQLINSGVSLPSGVPTYTFFGGQMSVSNSQEGASLVTLAGLSTNGVGNSLAFYDAPASVQNTNAIADSPLTLGGGTFIVSNNLAMASPGTFNYQLGTNASTVAVKGNLTMGGTVNIDAGNGFTNGVYTLFTYTGALSGSPPTLGTVPPGYDYAVNTSTSGQVNLIVTSSLPSLTSTNLNFQLSGNQLKLSWPPDHLGWELQIQTNSLSAGLGANWVTWPASSNVVSTNIIINPANGSVFLRLVYP